MGIYLNPGGDGFQTAINAEIYVDKTLLIDFTNSVFDTPQKNICSSRPRRFGKTTTANMISAYYDRTVDSIAMFEDYNIAGTKNFYKHASKYDVIHVVMTEFIKTDGSDISTMLQRFTAEIVYDLQEEYPDVRLRNSHSLLGCLRDIYAKTRRKFVIIIDEWDCIFRIFPRREEMYVAYLDFLRDLLKDKNYTGLVYMTGILPIKKYGEHSALNMFREYSMENPKALAEFIGFTADEVKKLCEDYDVSYDECMAWYDGYQMSYNVKSDVDDCVVERRVDIYNPLSVVEAMLNRTCQNYWNKTETYEALRQYIVMNWSGLRDKVIRLVAGGYEKINTNAFKNDVYSFESADDVLTLLIHLGYLAYDEHTSEVYIPNNEVRSEFSTSIVNARGWESMAAIIQGSEKILQYTLDMNEAEVAKAISEAHFETSILQYNDENALSYVVSLAYYTARRKYNIVRELPTGKGFADLTFIPMRHYPDLPAIIVELKWDNSAMTAIKQVKRQEYARFFKNYNGRVLLVGISYNKKDKEHQCKIEEIQI